MTNVLKDEILGLVREAELLCVEIRSRRQENINTIASDGIVAPDGGSNSVWSRFRGLARRYRFIR